MSGSLDNALQAAAPELASKSRWAVLTSRLRRERASLPVAALLALWVLSMILLPVGRWTFGEAAIVPGVTLSALLQAAAVLVILSGAWGARRTLLTAALVIAAAWVVEFVGSHTGVPFGAYRYTDRLQPQLGAVPLLVPFAWLMMLPPAWAVGAKLSGRTRGLAFILASALAFTVWDLFLDPQMVGWHFWMWQTPVGYFGIPWVNFAGWFLGAALITALARPAALPWRSLLLIYAVTWALESIGQLFFWSLPGPAIAGFFGMGALLAAALWRQRTA
jgi:putative membrane protein